MNDKEIVDSQESEYCFPYHYISSMPKEGFKEYCIDTWGINYISTIEFMVEKISGFEFESLVDVGCGDGRLTRELALNLEIPSVTGIDYSNRAINLANAMNQDVKKIQFFAADITKIDLIERFDCVVLMEVFEHIPLSDTSEFIKAVSELLKPGGKLFLTVPHKNKPLEYKHFQHFSVESIKENLEQYFIIDEVIPFEKKGIMRKLFRTLLSNRFFILNNQRALSLLYAWYRNYIFYCESEKSCQRIYVSATVS